MTWVKLDDTVTEHPKCVALSSHAWTLWLHGLTYCSRNLTDGEIPGVMLARLSSVPQPRKVASELIDAGLWHDSDGSYWIHDYCEHQRTRADIEAERAAARARRNNGKRSQ